MSWGEMLEYLWDFVLPGAIILLIMLILDSFFAD